MKSRSPRLLSALVAVSLAIAACGSDDSSDSSDSETTEPSATTETSDTTESDSSSETSPAEGDAGTDDTVAESAATEPTGSEPTEEAASGGYPVTISHRMGETTIEERPERIVSLNVQWTDAVLAMGETPTAYVLSTAETEPYPWQEGLLDDAEVIQAADTIPYEAIAALDPDLILVTFAAPEASDFELLSDIAPTIGMLGDLQVDPWVDQVEVLGQVFAEPETAEAVIADVDADVAATAEALPGLEGATYTFANLVPGATIYVIADPDDGASRMFNALGMELDPDIVALDEDAVGRVEISYEEIGLLQADLVGVLLNGQDFDSIVGLSELPSNQNGTLIEFGYADIVGLNTPTPLSVPYLLDLMEPSFEIVAELNGASE